MEAREDLVWWKCNLKSCNGRCFILADPDLSIYSDASLSGWGAVCDGSSTREPWSESDSKLHINELELKAAFNTLQSFVPIHRPSLWQSISTTERRSRT